MAFIVTAPPYRHRAARSDVDFVLSALALDAIVSVFFLGAAVFQLAQSRQLADSGLGAGYKAWTALPDFGESRLYAETSWVDWCRERGIQLATGVIPLEPGDMRVEWRRCARALVL
jgi:sulfur relay (sulfurtransferase) DsrF/TusC family protein